MARIMGIDFGEKRSGIAVTDPMQIIVNALVSIETSNLVDFVVEYCTKENVEKLIIGWPIHRDGSATVLAPQINKFAAEIQSKLKNIKVDYQDERNTSVLAKEILLQSGIGKQKRKEKGRTDVVSSVLILQKYLGHI